MSSWEGAKPHMWECSAGRMNQHEVDEANKASELRLSPELHPPGDGQELLNTMLHPSRYHAISNESCVEEEQSQVMSVSP